MRNASAAICASMSARWKVASPCSLWRAGVDPRTGQAVVGPEYANWTTHPNNPAVWAKQAAE